MAHVHRNLLRASIMATSLWVVAASPAGGAEPPSETQLQRLMDTAAQAPESPDHDYVMNSLHSILSQAKDLKLTQPQTNKIKTITDQFERTRRDRELRSESTRLNSSHLVISYAVFCL